MTTLLFIRIILILIGIVGFSFILPISVALYYQEYNAIWAFIVPASIAVLCSLIAFFSSQKKHIAFSTRSSFVFVALAWTCTSLFGALPLYIGGYIPSLIDAIFESVSGFTTTGATILSEIETLPRCINLWRCQMHWLGGMGIVALTVALFPLLGVGGFQLIKAETTGPEKGKMTPKITNTAKALWIIYVVLTLTQAIALRIAGMDPIDALSHAFSTLGTGGFSSQNQSIGAYHSPAIEWICIIFMFCAALNFTMYFYAITGHFKEIWLNSEFKAFCFVVAITTLLMAIPIIPLYGAQSIRYSMFHVLTIISTTGFATADYDIWPASTHLILFVLFFLGGCSGSTAGGIKIVRWVVLGKQASNEIKRTLHPHGVFNIRLNGKAGRKDVVFSVTAFIFLYFLLLACTTYIGCLGNLDLLSSFSGALAILGNVGPAFKLLGPTQNYGFLPDFVKLWYCFAMLAGRLELYTMIIFFMPAYWKK
ncbi:MAG: TrkH family potassium uptake protein [Treponema sp.]|nr:TrkH family potassium uptake protein [Treponema sp.]